MQIEKLLFIQYVTRLVVLFILIKFIFELINRHKNRTYFRVLSDVSVCIYIV
jgi:hypothetical protein